MNLLVFNLAMDADDDVLGHTTGWVNALARRCAHVSVITMTAGRLAVDANVSVHSLGKERGLSEPRRLARFYRLVNQVLRERQVDACFAHMAPLFAVLFAPVARRADIPVLLWYAHTSVGPILRLAHAAVDRCVTATPQGFPLRSDKLFVLGHGIDVARFHPPEDAGPRYDTTAISVGRISDVKGLGEMLEGVAILRDAHALELRLHLVGGPATHNDRKYATRLRQMADELDIARLVSFDGPVPFGDVPAAYHTGGLFINLSRGALDKAILESMASGCIPISRNSSFAASAREEGLEWLVPDAGAVGLADRIVDVLDRTRHGRDEIVAQLRLSVVENHSLDRLGDQLVAHLGELAGSSW